MTVPQPVAYAIAAFFVVGLVTTVSVVALSAVVASAISSTGQHLSPQQQAAA